MLYSLIIDYFIPNSGGIKSIAYSVTVVALLSLVWFNCKEIGESFLRHCLLVAFFPLIFGLFWLFVWPGVLRLMIQGKKLSETQAAVNYRRYKRNREEQE